MPSIATVRDRSRALAMLDAIMSPEWAFRYYSYNCRWSPAEEMASMRDGSGNEYSIVFSPAGAYARGFDHESPMSPYRADPPAPWPGLFESVPEAFRAQITEAAFSDPAGTPQATVCFWRERDDAEWRTGTTDDGGAGRLFDVLLDGRPEAYQKFAEEYYEVAVDLEAVRSVYALRPLTRSIVSALNPEADLAGLEEDLAEIAYPARA
ncbi:hypothetical protein GCM10022419_085670 [Nonomuraea rosea]|uniref:Uncharacterized protein n=1 Tax=Nonomuraea rosea TaxID=638574 RepID=A0ABP6YTM5_9ACTN